MVVVPGAKNESSDDLATPSIGCDPVGEADTTYEMEVLFSR